MAHVHLCRKTQMLMIGGIFMLVLMLALWGLHVPGLQVGDAFWRKRSDNTYSLNAENTVTITRLGDTVHLVRQYQGTVLEADMTVTGGMVRCVYSDGDTVEGYVAGTELVDADGVPLWMSDGAGILVDGMKISASGKGHLTQTLYRMSLGETETREGMVTLICLVLLYPLGAMQFLYPDKMAFLFSRWYYAKPELSEAGRRWERIGGIMTMLAGAVLCLLPLII